MTLEDIAAELREQGAQRFANWNQAAFDSYIDGPASTLAQMLEWRDKGKPDVNTLANYCRLAFEGVGAGWLRVIQHELPPPTFLAHCLATLVPHGLGEIPRAKRSEVLQKLWNLGEGLAREPQWLNQYAITRTNWSTKLQKLDQHLADALAPVLSPLPPATWSGRYDLHVLNLREHAEAFVPGRLYLAAPAVLCIENRLDPLDTLAMLLQKRGQSQILGTVGRLPEHQESFDAPQIETTADAVIINGTPVAAPLITSPRQTVCIAGGFVVVSADDSQRLWLVEAA
jgi:hypothetical protein